MLQPNHEKTGLAVHKNWKSVTDMWKMQEKQTDKRKIGHQVTLSSRKPKTEALLT